MEEKIYDGSQVMTKEEANQILRDKDAKISNANVDSFVSLKDINKIYPNGAQAVYNFNLDINKHDFIVLVGPSGCGKSTTLRMIAGLEDITSGYLYIDKVMANYLESKNRDISMVFQSYALYPQMTVYDNIAFPLKVRKYSRKAVDAEASAYSRLIKLLTEDLVKVRKGLAHIEAINDKPKNKVYYLEKYLSCNRLAANELIRNAETICDQFTLKIDRISKSLQDIIENYTKKINAARVVLDKDYNIVEDGRIYSPENLTLKNLIKVLEMIDNDSKTLNKAIIAAYDPRGNKKASASSKFMKVLDVDEVTANIVLQNHLAFATGTAESINALKNVLCNMIDDYSSRVAPVSTDEITPETLVQVETLKAAVYYNNLAKENFKELHTLVNEKLLDNIPTEIEKLLNKFQTISRAEMDDRTADLVGFYQQKLEERCNKLMDEGYIITDNYELILNDEPVYEYKKLSKDEIREKVFNAASVLDLGPYLDRRPKELSGGQMQRVALGRAIVRNAKLFLMDEPLSNLDAKLRVAMRSEIVRLHESIGATTIYVTHDQTEAMTMATKIVIMSKGWVQQVGTPQEVYENPKNLFVATFIGSPAMNIIDGYLDGNVVTLGDGYRISLSDDFIQKHNEFYKRKIVECDEMINTLNNEVEVKCYQILQEVRKLMKSYSQNYEQICQLLSQIVSLAEGLNKKSRNDLVGAAKQALNFVVENPRLTEEVKTTVIILNNMLVNYETINNGDIEKIHSAQAFKKENTKVKSEEMVYNGRKHEFVWTRVSKKFKQKALARRAPKVHIEDPEGYLRGLKRAYEDALVNGHKVKIGIRPENIFLAQDNVKVNGSTAFSSKIDVVELMGNESLLHSNWNGIDFLAKITSGTTVNAHESVEFVLDKDKLHIFDINSGETII